MEVGGAVLVAGGDGAHDLGEEKIISFPEFRYFTQKFLQCLKFKTLEELWYISFPQRIGRGTKIIKELNHAN